MSVGLPGTAQLDEYVAQLRKGIRRLTLPLRTSDQSIGSHILESSTLPETMQTHWCKDDHQRPCQIASENGSARDLLSFGG